MSVKLIKEDIFDIIKQLIFVMEPSAKGSHDLHFVNAEELHLGVKIHNDLSLILDQYSNRTYSNLNNK